MPSSLDAHSAHLANKLLDHDADQRSTHTARFTPTAPHERRVVRKVDWRLLPMLCLVHLCCSLDRFNIGNAKLMGLEDSLQMSGPAYGWSIPMFFIGYILLEVPSNLALTLIRPSRWLGCLTMAWGGLCTVMAATHNPTGLLVLRFCLGAVGAGIFPGTVYYLTHWYCRTEIGARLALFFCFSALANVLSEFLAYALHGLEAWRWLMLIEGVPMATLGAMVLLWIPDGPPMAPWLTPDERCLLLQRRALPLKTAHGIAWRQVGRICRDPALYLHCVVQLGMVVPGYGMTFLLPTIIRGLGFKAATAWLLTIPSSVLAALVCLGTALHSDYRQERGFHIVIPAFVGVLGLVLVSILTTRWAQYGMLLLIVAGTNGGNMVNLAWVVNNMADNTQCAVASALMLAVSSIGGLVAGQMYHLSGAPRYLASHLGNAGALLATCTGALLLKWIWLGRNARDDCQGSNAQPYLA
ncbi:hypothetical protein H4R35_000237 [Dimargaris xerosporica]|nr:hypothetical protein H4R35_000237 [Dimargaris xerosporica]